MEWKIMPSFSPQYTGTLISCQSNPLKQQQFSVKLSDLEGAQRVLILKWKTV